MLSDLCNDENRPSLTSGAVAEECQDVSSKSTIDKMADAITGSNQIGLESGHIPKKCRNMLVEK